MANEFDLFTTAPTGASVLPVQDEFSSFVAPTTAQAPAPTPEKPAADLTKPAFLAPRQRATKLVERAATIKEEEAKKIPFDALWKDDNNYKVVQDYALARFGKETGTPLKGETKEDFINRFATHMRMVDGNPMDSYSELGYLNNAKPENVLKAGAAYELFKNTAGVFDAQNRGQKGFRPVVDFISSVVADPTTLFTLGAGKFVASPIAKAVAEKGIKSTLLSARGSGMAAAAPAVGFAGGATQNAQTQKIELNVIQAQLDEAKAKDPKAFTPEGQVALQDRIQTLEQRVKEGVDVGQVVLAGTLNAAGEVIGVLPFLKGSAKPLRLDDVINKDKLLVSTETKTATNQTVNVKATDPTEKALEDSYDIFEGRRLLNEQGKPTSVAQMEVRNDLNKKATLIAQDIWKQIPEFSPKGTEKVSDAIKRTLESVDTFDDVVFERALASADVTPDEFAKMFRTSVGDAARSLQSLSVVARLQNKLKNIDPAAAAELNKMYGDRNAITSAFSGIRDLGMRLDRELKGLMVSQISTTIRNAFSGMAVVTFGTAAETIESALYRMGKTAGELATGEKVTGSFTGGIKGVYDDAVRSAFYLGQKDLSADVTEYLLNGTPALYRKMVKTTGEAGPNDLSYPVRLANTFNVAQDAFFRKAMFTSSVEKQLSRVGINMYDVIAQNKQVPFDVLQNAVNEALSGTFSKMPTKGPMFHAVKFIEELGPIGSTVIPFPRFMANAMEWTYKHMPTGVLSGSTDIAAGLTKMAKGEADMGTKQLTMGLENFSKGAVGTAALYAAYKDRKENQDTAWNEKKNPDGSTVDVRAMFPAAPFYAAGDYLVKFEQGRTDEFKAKEFIEAMIGFKAPAGTFSWLGDKFAEAQSNAAMGEDTAGSKVKTFFGEWLGEYLGRALVPFQQLSDIIGAIDRNETLPRDAYQIPAGEEGFTSSATQQLMKRTPILKQELPVYQPPLREKAVFNENGPLKMLSGIAIKGVPSELEAEVTRLKVPSNKIFTSTGDKIVDADARKIMAPLVVEQFDNLKKTSFYEQGSKDLQKIALQNLINWAQSTAKELASDKATAAAFNEGKQPRLFEVQYSKLAPELKRVVVDTYKQQQGKDLDVTKDYVTALAIAEAMKGLPGYAEGGDVREVGKASLYEKQMKKLTASKLKVISGEFREVYGRPFNPDTDYREAVNLAKDVGLLGSGYAAGGAVNMVFGGSLGSTLAKKIVGETVEAGLKKSILPLSEIISKYSVAPAVEQTAKALVKPEVAASAITKTPPVKSKASPAVSEPKPVDAEMEKLVTEAEASFVPPPKVEAEVVPEIKTELPMETATTMSPYMKKLAETDLNKDKYGFSRDSDIITDFEVRQNTLTALKQMRTDSFDKLIEMPNVAGKIEDDVIAVAQGEYRAAKGKEVDVNDPKAVEDFVSFSMPLQEKLNKLREKYKDRPPKVLYHGTEYNAEERATKGFFDPQTLPADQARQQELNVGATSFTSDARFNYANSSFGGTNPENIVQTSIPYADYEFRRINMARDKYRKTSTDGDMNTIARSITGSPTVARPLGLPRSIGMRESEDAFTESEKLTVSRNMYETEKKTPLFKQQEDIFNTSLDRLQEFRNNFLSPNSLKPIKEGGMGNEEVQALKAYRLIRGLIRNEFRETGGKAASEAGLKAIVTSNQSTASRLNRIARSNLVRNFDLSKFIPDVVSTLEKVGSKDKAEALKVLEQQFKVLQKNDIGSAATNTEMSAAVKEETKAVDAIRDLVGGTYRDKETKKRIGLAKGGLASRR
jgi:hypothetical protein